MSSTPIQSLTALVGNMWLLNGLGTEAEVEDATRRVGLRHLGYLPPASLLAAGHRIAVCTNDRGRDRDELIESIEWSGAFDGWRHEEWRRGAAPLDDPGFQLLCDVPALRAPETPWPANRATRSSPTGEQLFREARRGAPSASSGIVLRQLERVTEIATGREWARAQLELARMHWCMGRYEARLVHATRLARANDSELAPSRFVAAGVIVEAETLSALKRPFDADVLVAAIDACTGDDLGDERATGLRLLAWEHFSCGDSRSGRALAERAVAQWNAIGYHAAAGDALIGLVNQAVDAGDIAIARDFVDRAIAQFNQVPARWIYKTIKKLEERRATLGRAPA